MASVNQMGEGTLPSVTELFSLNGKTAIVTGGTGGLGLSMAVALAEAGADVVSIQIANDPRAALLEEGVVKQCGRKLRTYETDVSDSPKLRETFQKIWSDGVVPDILLNCAGINRRSKVEDFKDEDIDAVGFLFSLPRYLSSCSCLIYCGKPGGQCEAE
jgi:2-deoxy-D-gluconate 3-dehydrogenase